MVDHSLDRGRLQDLLEERALAQDGMDSSRVQRIREDMVRAEARRLQPHYVESFFREAFQRLGGAARQREARRYEITHVPAPVRNRGRPGVVPSQSATPMICPGSRDTHLQKSCRTTSRAAWTANVSTWKQFSNAWGSMSLKRVCPTIPFGAWRFDAINEASAREKSIRHGHPSTLHLWWARRPLAAARAVIFVQMVDDPSEYVDVLLSDPKRKRAAMRALKKRRAEQVVTAASSAVSGGGGAEAAVSAVPAGPGTDTAPGERVDLQALRDMAAELERDRLFRIIEALVRWENTTNEAVLERARAEVWQSWRRACAANAGHPRARALFDRHRLPAFHDPFAGGGALPLEAQRLGLEAHASDLNPVAVLINKAMIEIPPRFAGKPPVNLETHRNEDLVAREWKEAQGLAEDVRYHARWMRDEAEKRIGHQYPKVEVTSAMVRERPDLKAYEGRELTVIAWLWVRTVKSPNPAFADVDVPLASTFMLSTKKGKEAYVEPVLEGHGYRFTVKVGAPADAGAAKAGTKLSRGANFRCLMSGTPIAGDYIKSEGKAGRMSARLTARFQTKPIPIDIGMRSGPPLAGPTGVAVL